MTDRTTITLPVSGRSLEIAPLDIFELACSADVPNIFLGTLQRMFIGNLIYAGIATKEEREQYDQPVDLDTQSLFVSYLVELGTHNPKLVRDLTKAREYAAQGVNVDLQARYTQRDLLFAYDAVLGRGGRLYAALFPEQEAEPSDHGLELVSPDAGNAQSAEPVSEHPDERELAGVPA